MNDLRVKREVLFLALIACIGFAVFANSLGGEFVYDDARQLVGNPLIQNPELYGRALTSDVWAFKSDGSVAASNYWRPTFTAFNIAGFQIFGLNPFGWHLANIFLHIGVCLLAYWLLRKYGLSQLSSLAISLVFAVHPVHTESVAWIAGSPDLIAALALLASLIFAMRAFDPSGKRTTLFLLLSVALYALALGAKEIAVVSLPLYLLVFLDVREERRDLRGVLANVGPFVLAGGVFFICRLLVIGSLSIAGERSAGFGSALLSIPEAFAFYVRQTIAPVFLGPNYPLRPVGSIGFANFALPLVVMAVVALALYFGTRAGKLPRFGVALFLLPLAGAFNITAFIPEQIVHDRYLYLPLLGAVTLIFFGLEFLIGKFTGRRATAAKVAAIILLIACLPLAARTFTYNAVWATDLDLWQAAVRVDPDSSFNWSQFGAELVAKKRFAEALSAYDHAVEVEPTALSLMGRSRALLGLERNAEAIADLQKVIATPDTDINAFTLYQAYETLGVAEQTAGDQPAAEAAFRAGIGRLPSYSAALTDKLAVILYLAGQKDQALAELEAVRPQADKEMLPDSKLIFLRLGMLYAERGRTEDAKRDLTHFLDVTKNTNDPSMTSMRRQASDTLRRLR